MKNFITLLIYIASSFVIWSQSTGVYDAYIFYNLGSGDQNLQANTFNGYQFDNISTSTFILRGGDEYTWKCDGGDVLGGEMYWRLYRADQTPGAFQNIPLNWKQNIPGGCGGNQIWGNTTQNIDVFSSITSPGVWVLEVYFIAFTNLGNRYYNNSGNNFKAYITFYNKTVANGNWNVASTWAAGVPTGYQPLYIQHNVYLNTSATAYSIIVSGANANLVQDDYLNLEFQNPYGINTIQFKSQNQADVYLSSSSWVIFNGNANMDLNYATNTIIKNGGLNPNNSRFYYSTLEIQSGGYLTSYPNYDEESTLSYNTGGTYIRYNEWKTNASSGYGVPRNVIVKTGTTLNLNTTDEIYALEDIIIMPSATINMNYTSSKSLYVFGFLQIEGNFNFSGEIGGDLKIKGDFIKTSTGNIDWGGGNPATDKGRAVFFIGNGQQAIVNISQIPFIIIENNAEVYLYNTDLTVDGDGLNFLTITGNGSLDLNGKTLQCLANGRIVVDGSSGNPKKVIKSTATEGKILFTGNANGTIYSENGGILVIDSLVTIAVESGTIDFGNNITELWGTVEIRGQASIANNHYPIYKPGSTLKYVNISSITTSAEWPNTNGPTNLWFASPNNSVINLNENKTISSTGRLIYQNGQLNLNSYTLTYENNSVLEYFIEDNQTYTINATNAAEWTDQTNPPYNVEITRGKVVLNTFRKTANNLSILNNARFDIAAVNGQLTVSNNLIIANNATFTIRCNNSNEPAGSLIVDGDISNNGTMLYERYIPGFHYTYFTPPNLNTNSSLFTNNPNGYYNPNIYTYDETYDANPDPENSLYEQWTNPANGFSNAWISAENTLMNTPGRGYAYYNDLNQKFNFNGTFVNNSINVSISYTPNDGNGNYFDGWNLVANPYAAPIDANELFNSNSMSIQPTVYYWDGTESNLGNYKYYNWSPYDDGTNCVNGGSPYIPALQGFFVKAFSGEIEPPNKVSDLFISKSFRVHNSNYNFWKKDNPTKKSIFARLSLIQNNYSDETVIRFIPEASSGFDSLDAYKLYAYNAPQIYSYITPTGFGLAINSQNKTNIGDTINLGYVCHNTQTSHIKLTESYSPDNYIVLIDKLYNTKQNLSFNNTFEFTTINGDIRNRFAIVFEKNNPPQIATVPYVVYKWRDTINFEIDKSWFSDNNTDDKVTISIADLPAWLKFNSNTMELKGVAPVADTFAIEIVATDLGGLQSSATLKIIVLPALPSVDIQSINVSNTYTQIDAQILDNGGLDILQSGFYVGTTPTIDTNQMLYTQPNNIFSITLTDLLPATVYFVSAFAKNNVGYYFSDIQTFTTLALNYTDKLSNVFVFPNPFDDIINININNSETYIYDIYDLNGKKLISGRLTTKIDASELQRGIYLLTIYNQEYKKDFKIVKR